MSLDFTVKPVGAPAPATAMRSGADAAGSGVATDLPAAQSVAQASAAASSSNDPRADSENLSRQVLFDRATAEVVYRVVDNRTDRIVRQVPEQAMLRLRAYTRATTAAEQQGAPLAARVADRRI